MSDRILVAYASRAGATAEVAAAVAGVLRQAARAEVDLAPAGEVADMGAYRAAVIGSAAYLKRWMPPAVALVERHRARLVAMPVALFTVCLTLQADTPANRATVRAYLDPWLTRQPELRPVALGLFAGALRREALSVGGRRVVDAMGEPDGDHRDWDAIRAWAARLPQLLA